MDKSADTVGEAFRLQRDTADAGAPTRGREVWRSGRSPLPGWCSREPVWMLGIANCGGGEAWDRREHECVAPAGQNGGKSLKAKGARFLKYFRG